MRNGDLTDLTDYLRSHGLQVWKPAIRQTWKSALRCFSERDVYQQVGGDGFEFLFQGGDVAVVGHLEAGRGFKQLFAGHGAAGDFTGKFLDVYICARQGG